MPEVVRRFLELQNGAILFSGAINIFGVHSPEQLLPRDDPFAALPYNIELENENHPTPESNRFLSVGSYGFDGSLVCIDRQSLRIYVFKRGASKGSSPLCAWHSLDEWIESEIVRLSVLYDRTGRRLVDESRTLPHLSSDA